MIVFWVYIGPESVFLGLQILPETHRLLIGKGDAADRFNRFEPVFPRQDQTDRRAILIRHWLAINSCRQERQIIAGFVNRHPFNIRPWVPTLPLSIGDITVKEGFDPDYLM